MSTRIYEVHVCPLSGGSTRLLTVSQVNAENARDVLISEGVADVHVSEFIAEEVLQNSWSDRQLESALKFLTLLGKSEDIKDKCKVLFSDTVELYQSFISGQVVEIEYNDKGIIVRRVTSIDTVPT